MPLLHRQIVGFLMQQLYMNWHLFYKAKLSIQNTPHLEKSFAVAHTLKAGQHLVEYSFLALSSKADIHFKQLQN